MEPLSRFVEFFVFELLLFTEGGTEGGRLRGSLKAGTLGMLLGKRTIPPPAEEALAEELTVAAVAVAAVVVAVVVVVVAVVPAGATL